MRVDTQSDSRQVFRIGDASRMLGLRDKNSNTLRGWAEEFRDFLSHSANPDPGKPRYFTWADLQVLRAVREMRAHHLSFEEIGQQLVANAHAVELVHDQPHVTPLHDEGAQTTTSEALDDSRPHSGAISVTTGQALVSADYLEQLVLPLQRALDEWQAIASDYRSRLEAREARITDLEARLDTLQGRLSDLTGQSAGHTDAERSQPSMPAPAEPADSARALNPTPAFDAQRLTDALPMPHHPWWRFWA